MKLSNTLWRHGNFLRFWAANIISDFGSGITFLALPIVAAVSLKATGLFVGYGALPFGALLGGLLGEWLGLRTAVAISSIDLLLSALWVYFSPLQNNLKSA